MEFLRRNRLVVLVVAIFLGILIFVVLPWGYKSYVKSKQATAAQQENPNIELDKLYDGASKDLKNKKYDDALGKFESLIKVAPNYRDTKTKIREARSLRKNTLSELPPSERPSVSGENGNDGVTGNNAGKGNNNDDPYRPPRRTSPKEIPADATPLSLLPEKIEGFKTVQRRWESQPIEAAGRYDPIDKDVKDKVEMVWIVVSKWKNKTEAETRLKNQKEAFPEDPQALGINGHNAHFSLTFESRPDIFPSVVTLAWDRVTWFFAIEVVPFSTPSTDYKKTIGEDVAAEFGY